MITNKRHMKYFKIDVTCLAVGTHYLYEAFDQPASNHGMFQVTAYI